MIKIAIVSFSLLFSRSIAGAATDCSKVFRDPTPVKQISVSGLIAKLQSRGFTSERLQVKFANLTPGLSPSSSSYSISISIDEEVAGNIWLDAGVGNEKDYTSHIGLEIDDAENPESDAYLTGISHDPRGLKGSGLGSLLFVLGANYIYNLTGHNLRSTRHPSPAANRAWKKFVEIGWAERVRVSNSTWDRVYQFKPGFLTTEELRQLREFVHWKGTEQTY